MKSTGETLVGFCRREGACMGITYRIDADEGLIRSRFEGELTLEQIKEHSLRIRREAAFHKGLRELAEVGNISPRLTPQDILGFTDWLSSLEPFRAIAVVCRDDLSFGLARMFSTLMARSVQDVEAFRDMDTAVRWLDSLPVSD